MHKKNCKRVSKWNGRKFNDWELNYSTKSLTHSLTDIKTYDCEVVHIIFDNRLVLYLYRSSIVWSWQRNCYKLHRGSHDTIFIYLSNYRLKNSLLYGGGYGGSVRDIKLSHSHVIQNWFYINFIHCHH